MKRLSYLILLSLFISCSDDDPINYRRDGDEVFDSMERLQELSGVSTFIGDLKISGNITSLESLINLNTIQGSLIISVASDLESLDGLNNLRQVDGIEFFHNDVLSNIDALSGVTTTHLFKLKTLPALTSLDGLGALHVEGSILISYTPQLTEIGDNITITSGDSDNIYLAHMDNLVTANFLQDVREANSIWISDNPKLELNGVLSTIERGTTIHMENNDLLTSINLSSLDYVEHFRILGNENLITVSIDGTEQISYEPFKSPEIRIMSNPKLTEVNGFNNIPRSDIRIFWNNALTSISGLRSIEEVYLIVGENPLLSTVDLFADQSLAVQRLHFIQNGALFDFCGLNQVLSIDLSNADVFIEENGFNPTVEMLTSGECSSN